jgi:3'(2'), 5'-bisphosphate nucleotidase
LRNEYTIYDGTPMKTYEKELQVAIRAARTAARLAEGVRLEMATKPKWKRDGTPVTVADFVSQAFICHTISESFPSDPIVAEEDASSLTSPDMADILPHVTHHLRRVVPDASPERIIRWIGMGDGHLAPRYWMLDPIDGTKGFLRDDHYAVAIALYDKGVQLGVLACPTVFFDPERIEGDRGVLFAAVRGRGAFVSALGTDRHMAIRVSNREEREAFRLVESFESAHSDHESQVAVAKSIGITAPSLRMDGQVKYGVVARGEAALYLRVPSPKTVHYREKIWDHGPGMIIVEEAGGQVTDIFGKPLDFSESMTMGKNRGIVASNGSIHEETLANIRRLLSKRLL